MQTIPTYFNQHGWDIRMSFKDLLNRGHAVRPIAPGYNGALWVEIAGIGKAILLKGYTHCIRVCWTQEDTDRLCGLLSWEQVHFTCKPRVAELQGLPGVLEYSVPTCF